LLSRLPQCSQLGHLQSLPSLTVRLALLAVGSGPTRPRRRNRTALSLSANGPGPGDPLPRHADGHPPNPPPGVRSLTVTAPAARPLPPSSRPAWICPKSAAGGPPPPAGSRAGWYARRAPSATPSAAPWATPRLPDRFRAAAAAAPGRPISERRRIDRRAGLRVECHDIKHHLFGSGGRNESARLKKTGCPSFNLLFSCEPTTFASKPI
jgi:hypothetical protein